MLAKATIDLVVPYYGSRTLLEETVASVRAQTRDEWRLVVVEDGDQGQAVCEWLSELHDPRIEHVLNPRNVGISANFQRCLDLSSAPLVTFLGCDDRLLPNYVEQVTQAMDADPRLSGYFPGVTVIDDEGLAHRPAGDRIKSSLRPSTAAVVQGEDLLRSLAVGNWTYFPATCWRTHAIAQFGFRQDLRITLDLALLSDLVLAGHVFGVGQEPAFEYRRHRNSASSLAMADVSRLQEEVVVHDEMARQAGALGWTRAQRAARLRLTSRLHALTLAPRSLGRPDSLKAIGRHAFGR